MLVLNTLIYFDFWNYNYEWNRLCIYVHMYHISSGYYKLYAIRHVSIFVLVFIVWIMVQDTFRHDKTRNRRSRENVVKLTLPCGRLTDPHSENSNMTSFGKVCCNTYHENDWHFWYIFITSFYTYFSFTVAQIEA